MKHATHSEPEMTINIFIFIVCVNVNRIFKVDSNVIIAHSWTDILQKNVKCVDINCKWSLSPGPDTWHDYTCTILYLYSIYYILSAFEVTVTPHLLDIRDHDTLVLLYPRAMAFLLVACIHSSGCLLACDRMSNYVYLHFCLYMYNVILFILFLFMCMYAAVFWILRIAWL